METMTVSPATVMQATGTQMLEIRDGSLYLPYPLYRTFFDNLEAVVLLRHDAARLLILPVRHAGGGGLLIKIRNRRGDRVIHAREFFREQGIDDALQRQCPVRWDDEHAGLVVDFP